MGAIARPALDFGHDRPAPAACDATISTSRQLEAKLRSSKTGEVVCLRSGNYDRLKLSDIDRHGYATFQPATDARVTLAGLELTNVAYVRFRNFTGASRIAGENAILASDHVQLVNNRITGGPFGIYLRGVRHALIRGNRIAGFRHGCGTDAPEGYVIAAQSFYDGGGEDGLQGLVIDDNDIGDNAGQDGVQLAGGAENGTEDIRITRNVFHDIAANASCPSDHADSIQIIGGARIVVRGNTFRRVQNACLWGDDVLSDAVVEDNLMIGDRRVPGGVGNFCQIFDAERLTFRHNTVVRVPGATWLGGLLLRSEGHTGSPSARVEDNILEDSDLDADHAGYKLAAAGNVELDAGPPQRAASYRGGFPFENLRSFAPLRRLGSAGAER